MKNKANETIRYALGEFFLGYILVASSAGGVVAILTGKNGEDLVHELQHRFPAADVAAGDKESAARLKEVIRFTESPERPFRLPLDIRGTDFQKRVWQAVRKIPAGKTLTYKDIARKIGAPRAMRAVGTSCSMNPLAFVVPCHRVTHSGSSARQSAGAERRRRLVAREKCKQSAQSVDLGL